MSERICPEGREIKGATRAYVQLGTVVWECKRDWAVEGRGECSWVSLLEVKPRSWCRSVTGRSLPDQGVPCPHVFHSSDGHLSRALCSSLHNSESRENKAVASSLAMRGGGAGACAPQIFLVIHLLT